MSYSNLKKKNNKLTKDFWTFFKNTFQSVVQGRLSWSDAASSQDGTNGGLSLFYLPHNFLQLFYSIISLFEVVLKRQGEFFLFNFFTFAKLDKWSCSIWSYQPVRPCFQSAILQPACWSCCFLQNAQCMCVLALYVRAKTILCGLPVIFTASFKSLSR